MNTQYLNIRKQIDQIALESNRLPDEIILIAVSKKQPVEALEEVYEVGCRQFGENQIQEALAKKASLPKDISWHFIGTLQKNKVRKAVGSFALMHSVDSLELAQKIDVCSREAGCVTSILLQVNITGEQTKHGLAPHEWRQALPELLTLSSIRLEGLMTIGPFVENEDLIRQCFRELRMLKEEFQVICNRPDLFKHLSMGMSDDFRIAIQEGATLLRIGTSIFGSRIR